MPHGLFSGVVDVTSLVYRNYRSISVFHHLSNADHLAPAHYPAFKSALRLSTLSSTRFHIDSSERYMSRLATILFSGSECSFCSVSNFPELLSLCTPPFSGSAQVLSCSLICQIQLRPSFLLLHMSLCSKNLHNAHLRVFKKDFCNMCIEGCFTNFR